MIVIYESNRLDHPFSIAKLISETKDSVRLQRLIEHREIDETDQTFLVRKSNVINILDDSHIGGLRLIQKSFSERYWQFQESKTDIINYFKEIK